MHEWNLVAARLADLERTPAWLAKQLGVDRAMPTRWSQGEAIPVGRRREIALALGKPADWLDTIRPADQPEKAAA